MQVAGRRSVGCWLRHRSNTAYEWRIPPPLPLPPSPPPFSAVRIVAGVAAVPFTGQRFYCRLCAVLPDGKSEVELSDSNYEPVAPQIQKLLTDMVADTIPVPAPVAAAPQEAAPVVDWAASAASQASVPPPSAVTSVPQAAAPAPVAAVHAAAPVAAVQAPAPGAAIDPSNTAPLAEPRDPGNPWGTRSSRVLTAPTGPVTMAPRPPPVRPGGFLFICSDSTFVECISRSLFGLPKRFIGDLLNGINVGGNTHGVPATQLFLFNIDTCMLHGVFEAASEAAIDIEPKAWRQPAKPGSPFSAQIRVHQTVAYQPCGLRRNRMPTGRLTPEQTAECLSMLKRASSSS